MASPWSKRPPTIKEILPTLAIGAKVRRYFLSHELGPGVQNAHWLEGVVQCSKSGGGKGKKAKEIWWTVLFDAPAPRPLCLSSVQVAEMRICAMMHRDKFAGLEQQLGKELTVEWTVKDERICVHGSKLKLRNCYLVEFVPASQSFMLRYRCGFQKFVDETQLVLLLEESIIHKGSNKKKTRDLVTLAEAEVLSTLNRQQQETSPVENSVAVERQMKVMADDLVTREKELQAKKNAEALKELKLRESVLQLQLQEAAALAQQQEALLAKQEEETLQLEKDKVEEERLALLQQEETEKALSLEKEKGEVAMQALLAKQEEERLQLEKDKEEERLALLQQQETEKALSLEKEKEDAAKQALKTKQEEERLQREKDKAEEERLQLEIEKAEEERIALLAKQEEERLQLEKDKEDKDKDVDKEEESDNARGKQPYEDLPPPPQHQPPTMDLKGLWTAFLEQQHGIVQPAAVPSNPTKTGDGQPPKKKRKTSRGRTKVKGEKNGGNAKQALDADGKEAEEEDLDDFDWDDQHVQQSANTARRILWQRGHAANVPSKVKELIAAATVTRVEDAMEPLQTLGFAILEDMTVAFSPKNRCTKEQRDFITKCKTHTFP